MTIAQMIVDWALPLTVADIPAEAKRDACLHLLDGIGCAIAASKIREAPYAVAAALEMGGPKEATVIGEGARVSAPAAALANGTLIHALDFDDTHAGALVHATAAVAPAAFAVGEALSSSGAEVLAAAIAGYETVVRLGEAVPHGFHAKGFHATSVCGVFASALVAAKLMRLSPVHTVNALGIAGSMAAGSLEFLHAGSSTKQLHPGIASMNGILAARLAAAGADGPDSIFEGEYGLYRSYLGVDPEPEFITKSFGVDWEISKTSIKWYPACQLSHAALNHAKHIGVAHDAIERVVVEIPGSSVPIICEPVAEKRAPTSAYEAKFSLQWCLAAMLVDGELRVDSFEADMLKRPELLELANRIDYRAVPYEGPPATFWSPIEVTLKDGSTVPPPAPIVVGGSAPVDEPDLFDKFRSNGGWDTLRHQLMKLGELPNVRGLLA